MSTSTLSPTSAGLPASGTAPSSGRVAARASAPGRRATHAPQRPRRRPPLGRRVPADEPVVVSVRSCRLDAAVPTRLVAAAPTGAAPQRTAAGLAVPAGQAVQLTRRGRAALMCGVLAVTLVLASVAAATMAGGSRADAPIVYETVTVQPGESLWEIARVAAPDTDPRSTISWIAELNDLPTGGTVRAGQQLTVPATP